MLREFYDWWSRQMLDLVPDRFRLSLAHDVDSLFLEPMAASIDAGPPVFSMELLKGRRFGQLGQFRLDESGVATARQVADEAGLPASITLRLPEELLLEKRVGLPLAAERDVDRVLTYEMDRETPFTAEEVWWSSAIETRDRTQNRLSVRLSLVPKLSIAPLLEAFGRAGLPPTSLEILLRDGVRRSVPLDDTGHRRQAWHAHAVPIAAGLCAVLAVAAIALPFVTQSLAIRGAEAEIGTLRPQVDEAERLRRQLQGAGGSDVIQAEHTRFGNPLAVLAAATTLLPDDTYLTDFTMQQRRITMNGQSVGPAKLIGALAADPTFKDPAFAAPSTHAEGSKTDVFSISAEARP